MFKDVIKYIKQRHTEEPLHLLQNPINHHHLPQHGHLPSPGKHDVVAVLPTRSTAGIRLRVVGAAKVVADLMGECDVADSRRNVFAIVKECDDPRVEALWREEVRVSVCEE